jgi:3-isopropylmalate dehydrogenase
MLQSFSMLLRYSFERDDAADLLDAAIGKVLASGLRTADIMQPGMAKVSTSTMGESIVRELDKAAAELG